MVSHTFCLETPCRLKAGQRYRAKALCSSPKGEKDRLRRYLCFSGNYFAWCAWDLRRAGGVGQRDARRKLAASWYDKQQPLSNRVCLFAPSVSEVSLESSSTLDTTSIGEQLAAITLSNSAGSKEVTVRFLVQDTQIPEVQIKEETVSLSQGDEFDPSSNVTAKDSVDGVLSQVDSRPEAKRSSDGAERYESGWFMLSYTDPSGNAVPSIDTSVTGAYRVSAIAYDKNGNCSGDSYFTVVVKATETSAERSAVTEEETAQEEDSTQQSSEQSTSTAAPATHDYVLNTNAKKIHDPGCSSIKKMKEQNKQTVNSTLADLEAQGYEPCNKCHPR